MPQRLRSDYSYVAQPDLAGNALLIVFTIRRVDLTIHPTSRWFPQSLTETERESFPLSCRLSTHGLNSERTVTSSRYPPIFRKCPSK